jgi:hypothetical protein
VTRSFRSHSGPWRRERHRQLRDEGMTIAYAKEEEAPDGGRLERWTNWRRRSFEEGSVVRRRGSAAGHGWQCSVVWPMLAAGGVGAHLRWCRRAASVLFFIFLSGGRAVVLIFHISSGSACSFPPCLHSNNKGTCVLSEIRPSPWGTVS